MSLRAHLASKHKITGQPNNADAAAMLDPAVDALAPVAESLLEQQAAALAPAVEALMNQQPGDISDDEGCGMSEEQKQYWLETDDLLTLSQLENQIESLDGEIPSAQPIANRLVRNELNFWQRS